MQLFTKVKIVPLFATLLVSFLGVSSSYATNYGAPYDTWTEEEGFEVKTWAYPDGEYCLALGTTSHFIIPAGETMDFELDLGNCDKDVVVALGYLTKKTSSLQSSFGRAKFDFALEETSDNLKAANESSSDSFIVILGLNSQATSSATSGSRKVLVSVTSRERKDQKIRITFNTQ